MRHLTIVLTLLLSATPAFAQRFPFERTIDAAGAITLDVSTIRGKIDVSAGEPGRVVVAGAATVRIGWDVPSNAVQLAEQFAATFAIERLGSTIRLRPPAGSTEQRAMTINYQVKVPLETQVVSLSDSGAITVMGIAGTVKVRTQSGAIELQRLGGTTDVTSGSGSVAIDGVRGPLTVSTSSSGVTARSLGSDVRVQTSSGAVELGLTGEGSVDVETSSSSIHVQGARNRLRTKTQSGRTIVRGSAAADWDVTSGSGSVEAEIEPVSGFKLDASSGSGSVTLSGATAQGQMSKRRINGTVLSDGPLVRITTRSGSVSLNVVRR